MIPKVEDEIKELNQQRGLFVPGSFLVTAHKTIIARNGQARIISARRAARPPRVTRVGASASTLQPGIHDLRGAASSPRRGGVQPPRKRAAGGVNPALRLKLRQHPNWRSIACSSTNGSGTAGATRSVIALLT